MDVLQLVKDYGIPLTLLIAAVLALWRAWQVERKIRDQERDSEINRYRKMLESREEELHELYKDQARKNLRDLVLKEKAKRGK